MPQRPTTARESTDASRPWRPVAVAAVRAARPRVAGDRDLIELLSDLPRPSSSQPALRRRPTRRPEHRRLQQFRRSSSTIAKRSSRRCSPAARRPTSRRGAPLLSPARPPSTAAGVAESARQPGCAVPRSLRYDYDGSPAGAVDSPVKLRVDVEASRARRAGGGNRRLAGRYRPQPSRRHRPRRRAMAADTGLARTA